MGAFLFKTANDVDFCAFFDYFGLERVILSQYLPTQTEEI